MALFDYFWMSASDLIGRGTSNQASQQSLTAAEIQRLSAQLTQQHYDQMKSYYNAMMFGQAISPQSLYQQSEPVKDDTPKSDLNIPEGILPGDGRMIGYLEGYRAWRFSFKEARLRSDNFDEVVWQPKIPIKATFQGKAQVGKGAGIYASKDIELIEKDYDPNKIVDTINFYSSRSDKSYVIGKIALWGAIKEHKNGYRAEYAYPLEFLKVTNVAPELEFVLLRALSEIYLPRKR